MFIKRMLCIIMAAMVILSLVACGGTTAPEATPVATTVAAVTTTAGTTTTSIAETTATTNEGTTTEPTLGPPKTVKLMILTWPEAAFDNPDLVIYQRLNTYANVKIEPIAVDYQGYDDKINLMFVSGELPDLILDHGYDVSDHKLINEQIGPSGMLVPIGDYLDRIPSYKKLIEKYKSQLPIITATDGKIYIAATINDYKSASSGIMMREDKLKAAGIDPSSINTTEDLYAALIALRDQNGGKVVVDTRYSNILSNIPRIFGGGNGMRWNPDTKEWYQAAITDNTKAAVIFMNNMIKDNILSKDWASTSDEVWWAGMKSGTLFATYDNMQTLDQFNKALATDLGPDAKFVGILTPTYNGVRYAQEYGGGISNGGGFVISAKTEALDNIFMMLEFLYNDENQEFIMYGDEGVTFTRRADGTPQVMPGQNWEAEGKICKEYGCGYADGILMVRRESRLFEAGYNDLSTSGFYSIWQKYAEKVWLYQNPVFQLNATELDRINALKPAISTYISESLTQFISGVRTIDKWDDFVAKVNDMGQPEYTEIQNTATKRSSP